MANVKVIHVPDAVIIAALRAHLHEGAVSALLLDALRAHLHDDPAAMGALPSDARIVGHEITEAGIVSLEIQSPSFPWVPDGLPLEQISVVSAK